MTVLDVEHYAQGARVAESSAVLTPFELVSQYYKLPDKIQPFPQQIQVVNDRSLGNHNGEWLDMGTGKTWTSTWVALYHKLVSANQTVVIMPPILVDQWRRWLQSISPVPSFCAYQGTPKERKEMGFDVDFLLVGINIFRNDFERIEAHYRNRSNVTVITDEATIVANVETDSHRKVFDFSAGRVQLLLSGTPANKPGDAYGLIKFTSPGAYRNKRHFENMHVADRDFFGNPCAWQQLDVLYDNLASNSSRILYEDIYKGEDPPHFIPHYYSLDRDHYKLYRKLAEEEILELENGGKIDATSVQKLRHALGQIVVNHAHFAGDDKAKSAALDVVSQSLDELGGGKLLVFADYRMTIARVVEAFKKHDARAINSQVSPTQKQRNLEAFIEGDCRLLVVQFVSGGKGLDGLQHVCNDCLFLEPCQQPRDFHQAVARLKRLGQRKRVRVKMAIAEGTLQVRGFKNLLNNDDTLNQVIRNAYELRSMIFGG